MKRYMCINKTQLLKVEKLFKSKFYGPYIRKDGRAYMVGYNSHKTFSILLSRLKMCYKLNLILDNSLEVDHINNNPFDDRLSNLQVLSSYENKVKANKIRYNDSKNIVICPYCNKHFKCRPSRIKLAKSKGHKACCSVSCARKLYWNNQY